VEADGDSSPIADAGERDSEREKGRGGGGVGGGEGSEERRNEL